MPLLLPVSSSAGPGALWLASESSPEELSESKPAQDKRTVVCAAGRRRPVCRPRRAARPQPSRGRRAGWQWGWGTGPRPRCSAPPPPGGSDKGQPETWAAGPPAPPRLGSAGTSARPRAPPGLWGSRVSRGTVALSGAPAEPRTAPSWPQEGSGPLTARRDPPRTPGLQEVSELPAWPPLPTGRPQAGVPESLPSLAAPARMTRFPE